MGYSTDFFGEFTITPPLDAAQIAYLQKFNETRRVKRRPEIAATMPDPEREAVGLPIGEPDAAYFTGGAGFRGQGTDPSIIDDNCPPGQPPYRGMDDFSKRQREAADAIAAGQAQPGLWCQWVPSDDGSTLVWDEGEKFYDYVEWVQYIIDHFLKPWGRTLGGHVRFQGEDTDDRGAIVIVDGRAELRPDDIIPARVD